MKFKLTQLFLALGVATTLAACGSGDGTPETTEDSAPAVEEISPDDEDEIDDDVEDGEAEADPESEAEEEDEGGEGGEG